MGLQQSFKKQRPKRTNTNKTKDKMETSGVVYEADCNNCLKRYTGNESGRKLKERMKEHKDDGEKSR